jgi:hypothetical protein
MKGNDRIAGPPVELCGPPLPPQVESMVPDARAGVSPSQMVDRKLACQLGYKSPQGNFTSQTDGAAPPHAPARQPTSRETPLSAFTPGQAGQAAGE